MYTLNRRIKNFYEDNKKISCHVHYNIGSLVAVKVSSRLVLEWGFVNVIILQKAS
jgi:uncharacterized protein YebE (UPF0316 family)